MTDFKKANNMTDFKKAKPTAPKAPAAPENKRQANDTKQYNYGRPN